MTQTEEGVLRRPFVQRTTIWIPVIVIGLLWAPIALTNRAFGADWTLHLWLIRQQQLNLQAMWHPGLFVSVNPLGAFYPVFAFVGSGVYTLGGLLAILLGGRPLLAYKLLYLGGLCLAYGGMTWLSVQVGLRGWRSQMPGLVFVTGAYFVTDMVGRGDFGEFVALAAIPFLIAAISAAFTTPTLRTRNWLAIILGSFVLSGSHNITLLWGSVFIVLLGVVAVLAFGASWRPPWPWPRVRAVLLGGVIGVGLNAWFLLPDLAYGLTTQGAKKSEGRLPSIAFTQLGYLLNPLRTARRPSLSRDIRVTTPWMFALWALVLGIALWRGRERRSRTFFVGLFAITFVYLVLLFDRSAWRFLPKVFYNLQFTWRLHAYVLLATAGLVMVVLLWHTTAPPGVRNAATVVLLVLVSFSVGVATWQVWRVRPTALVGKHFQTVSDQFVDSVVAAKTTAPSSWYAPTQFRDVSPPIVTPASERRLHIPFGSVKGDHFSGVLPVPDGSAPFRTNITAARPLLHFGGIKAVGRDRSGSVVAVRAPVAPPTGPLRVTISPARSPVIVGGELLSVASLLALFGIVLWPLLRRLRAYRVEKRVPVAE